MWMCMQMYLLALRGCLTFKIHGTASLPAAFPGSSACFQDCKDDWQMACREFLPSPCTFLPGVRFSSSLPTPPCCSHPSCLFSAFCRASQAMCSNIFFQMKFLTVVKKGEDVVCAAAEKCPCPTPHVPLPWKRAVNYAGRSGKAPESPWAPFIPSCAQTPCQWAMPGGGWGAPCNMGPC